jgi:hypothetical protein
VISELEKDVEETPVAQFEALPLIPPPRTNEENNKKFVTTVPVKILKECFQKGSQNLGRLNKAGQCQGGTSNEVKNSFCLSFPS